MREAHAALDAIVHHETELPIREMMADTAGFTELMYALYDLQGLKLSPRIRDLADQRLYPIESVSEYGVLKPLFRGQAIQRELIVRCWDDMHRISASLKDGTVTAVLLVTKLQALDHHCDAYACKQPCTYSVARSTALGQLLGGWQNESFHVQASAVMERLILSEHRRRQCCQLRCLNRATSQRGGLRRGFSASLS